MPLSTPVTRTTRLLYDGSDLIAEYDGAAPDTVQRRHVHGPGIDEPLVTYAGSGTGNKTWLYSDHQGSVVAQAGASGANTAIDAYGPFGETDPAAGTRSAIPGNVIFRRSGCMTTRHGSIRRRSGGSCRRTRSGIGMTIICMRMSGIIRSIAGIRGG